MKNKIYFFLLLIFLSACGNKIKLDSVRMKNGTIESTVTTINSGTVEAKNQAELSFGSIGRIFKIYKNAGEKLKQGDLIAELENADLKAILNDATKELKRSNELFQNGLVAISQLDNAKKNREIARINFEKTLMTAPFEGILTFMDLKPGEFYQSAKKINNQPYVQMIDLKKRIIKGEVDEIDLQKIRQGNKARIKIPALKNNTINAIVSRVVPFVSTAKDQDRTGQIELEILDQNTNQLIPAGASADVEIITELKNNAQILPANVLFGAGKIRQLYKIVNGKLKKEKVKIGLFNYSTVEILEGVTSSDLIAKPKEGIDLNEDLKVDSSEIQWP